MICLHPGCTAEIPAVPGKRPPERCPEHREARRKARDANAIRKPRVRKSRRREPDPCAICGATIIRRGSKGPIPILCWDCKREHERARRRDIAAARRVKAGMPIRKAKSSIDLPDRIERVYAVVPPAPVAAPTRPGPEGWLSLKDAARFLRLREDQINSLRRQGLLTARRTPGGHEYEAENLRTFTRLYDVHSLNWHGPAPDTDWIPQDWIPQAEELLDPYPEVKL